MDDTERAQAERMMDEAMENISPLQEKIANIGATVIVIFIAAFVVGLGILAFINIAKVLL